MPQMRREDNRMSVYVIAQGKIENRGLIDQYVAKVSLSLSLSLSLFEPFGDFHYTLPGRFFSGSEYRDEHWWISVHLLCKAFMHLSLPQFTREATLTGFEPVLPP